MLRSIKDIESYKVSALDGDIGKVSDFLFDDQHWTARYLVTDTGGFWDGPNRVLVSPISFREVDWTARRFHVELTQEKVKNSPSVDLDRPVSRQYERSYSQYYGWPYYWGFGSPWAWGAGAYPFDLIKRSLSDDQRRAQDANNDPHLRSAREVAGYHVHGRDGEIGHVADLMVDDENWTIRYLVIGTSNWWFGKKVLIAPHWASKVSWSERMVYLDLTKEAIKSSPAWTPEGAINREYEQLLWEHYGRPNCWTADSAGPVGSGQPAVAKQLSF